MSRAISVYYFWGELFKLRGKGSSLKDRKQKWISFGNTTSFKSRYALGSTGNSSVIKANLFWYHGDEWTAPSRELANRYANNLPYNVGMPGPSFSWSTFGSTASNGIEYMKTGNVAPIILERLDESLVALSHHLGWSLADVVVVKPRKALSKHPGADQWPQDAVTTIRNHLQATGEYKFYDTADALLSEKIISLKGDGVNFDAEVSLLKRLRARTTEVKAYIKIVVRV